MLKKLLAHPTVVVPTAFYWTAYMIGNGMSWVFNLLASRYLSLENYSNVTFYTSVIFLTSMLSVPLRITVIKYLGKTQTTSVSYYLVVGSLLRYAVLAGLVSMALYGFMAPVWTHWFQFPTDPMIILVTSIALFLSFFLAWTDGVLHGLQAFIISGILILVQTSSKLAIVGLAPYAPAPLLMILSAIPIALVLSMLVGLPFIIGRLRPQWSVLTLATWKLPGQTIRFYVQSMVLQVGTLALISIDMILVKFYFPPAEAGVYALLSLVGKTFFFLNYSFIGLLIPLLSVRLHLPKTSRWILTRLLGIIVCLSLGFTSVCALPPYWGIQFLLPTQYVLITPYILPYCLTMTMVSLMLTFSHYQLLKERYLYSWLMVGSVVGEISLISLFHHSLSQVVYSLLTVSTVITGGMVLHYLYRMYHS